MLDYRLHYLFLETEERRRATNDPLAPANRGVKRLFRLTAARPAGRSAEHR